MKSDQLAFLKSKNAWRSAEIKSVGLSVEVCVGRWSDASVSIGYAVYQPSTRIYILGIVMSGDFWKSPRILVDRSLCKISSHLSVPHLSFDRLECQRSLCALKSPKTKQFSLQRSEPISGLYPTGQLVFIGIGIA